MRRALAARPIRTFKTGHGEEDQLAVQLAQFESNLLRANDEVWNLSASALVPTVRQTGTVRPAVSELATVDTASGDATVILPAPNSENAGEYIGIVRPSSSHVATVKAVGGGNVQGAASYTLPTAVGLHLFCSVLGAWWKVVA